MSTHAIYEGRVYHNRFSPVRHSFNYPLSMYWIDLNEVNKLDELSRFISIMRKNIVSFNPFDYAGKSGKIKEHINQRVASKYPELEIENIFLLTQLRRFGFVFNPVSFYFCYDGDNRLLAIASEIENTPWGERYIYVHKAEPDQTYLEVSFDKSFHVSPFLPMDMRYIWRFEANDVLIDVNMKCIREETTVFEAGYNATRTNLTKENANSLIRKDLFSTFKIVFYIYLNALFLWFKKVPFFEHPDPKVRRGD